MHLSFSSRMSYSSDRSYSWAHRSLRNAAYVALHLIYGINSTKIEAALIRNARRLVELNSTKILPGILLMEAVPVCKCL